MREILAPYFKELVAKQEIPPSKPVKKRETPKGVSSKLSKKSATLKSVSSKPVKKRETLKSVSYRRFISGSGKIKAWRNARKPWHFGAIQQEFGFDSDYHTLYRKVDDRYFSDTRPRSLIYSHFHNDRFQKRVLTSIVLLGTADGVLPPTGPIQYAPPIGGTMLKERKRLLFERHAKEKKLATAELMAMVNVPIKWQPPTPLCDRCGGEHVNVASVGEGGVYFARLHCAFCHHHIKYITHNQVRRNYEANKDSFPAPDYERNQGYRR